MAELLEPPAKESSIPDAVFSDLIKSGPSSESKETDKSDIPDNAFADIPKEKSDLPDNVFADIGPSKEAANKHWTDSLAGQMPDRTVSNLAPSDLTDYAEGRVDLESPSRPTEIGPLTAKEQPTYDPIRDADAFRDPQGAQLKHLQATITGIGKPILEQKQRELQEIKDTYGQSEMSDDDFLREHRELKLRYGPFVSDMPIPKLSEQEAKSLLSDPVTKWAFGPIVGRMPLEKAAFLVSGLQNFIGDMVDFMTSPVGMMTAMTGGVAGAGAASSLAEGQAIAGGISRAMSYAFATDMAYKAPEQVQQIGELIEAKNYSEATRAILGLIPTALVVGHAAHGLFGPKPTFIDKPPVIDPVLQKTAPQTAEAKARLDADLKDTLKYYSDLRAKTEAEKVASDFMEKAQAEAGTEKGATDASSQQSTTEVHGNVLEPEKQGQGTGQVPVNEGSEGVRPQPEPQKPAEPSTEASPSGTPAQPEVKAEPKSKADSILEELQKLERNEKNAPDRTRLYQQLGAEVVPGIRLGDAETAGMFHEMVKKGEATQAEFDEWINRAKKEGRIYEQEFPEYPDLEPPEKAGKGEARNIFKAFGEAVAKWEGQVKEWLKTKPENKGLIWQAESGQIHTLTRDPEHPWRVTHYSLNKDGNIVTYGHNVFKTREEAMLEYGKGKIKFLDKFPGKVLSEREFYGFSTLDEVGDRKKLSWYKLTGKNKDFGSFVEREKNIGVLRGLVIDSEKDGAFAFNRELTPEDMKRLDLERTLDPEAPAPSKADIESHLKVETPDDTEARQRVRAVDNRQAELRDEVKNLQPRIRELEKVVKHQRGPYRGRIKSSAKAKELAEFRELSKKQADLEAQIRSLDDAAKSDRELIDKGVDSKIINDPNQPLFRRIDRRIRQMGEKAPPELIKARDAELARIIREKYPDATPEEIAQIGPQVTNAIYFGEDPWKSMGVPDLYSLRSKELNQELNAAQSFAPRFTQELVNRTAEFFKKQTRPAAELAELKAEIRSQVEKFKAEDAAEAKRQAEVAEKEKAEEEKLLKEAQQVVDSAKRTGTKGGRSAKEVKADLVSRIWKALTEMSEKDKTKINKSEDGSYVAQGEGGGIAFGEIEETKGGFRVTVTNPTKQKIVTTVQSIEEGEAVIKMMAARGRGKAIVAVPGDGIYQLQRDGSTMLDVWTKAKRLDTTSGHGAKGSSAPAAEKPPTNIRTRDQWNEAKEFHGLNDTDKIATYSNALKEFADKVGDQIGKATDEVTTKDVDKWIEEKDKAAREKTKGKTTEQRIEPETKKTEKADPLDMDEGDLADWFDEQFGKQAGASKPGEFGRRQGVFTFPNYESFRDYMNARFAERDLEGMKLAFAEADGATKAKYAKEILKGTDEHQKAWIRHIATGAELPKDDGPIPRTTPRPTPTGRPGGGPAPGGPTPGPGQPGGPARPAEPPPPPRPPSGYRKFSITALVQAMRQFGQHPTINDRLQRAYGQLITATGLIELKDRLFWDPKLAERVLAHEFGHFIDLFIPIIGKGKGFADKVAPLWDFRNLMFRKSDLRQDARNLSRDWRGDFANGDPYRDTAVELFADFISAMFNNPEWVNQKYPRLHDAFQALRDAKPAFKNAYREIETWLQGDTMAKEMIDQNKKAAGETLDKLMETKDRPKASFMDKVKFESMSLWERVFEREGKPRQIGSSVAEKLATSYMWASRKLAVWHDDFVKTVQKNLDKVSDNANEARGYLLSYTKAIRTIGERRAAGVWIERNPEQARQMLDGVLNLDPTLNSRFRGALDSAPDSALYDLSAVIFREIHDRGDTYVRRMSNQIDSMNLGVDGDAALMAFNVRGKLLNPGGETTEMSQKILDELKNQLGPDRYKALEDAAHGLRDLIWNVQSEMHDTGLISDKVWNELIAPNKDNYVPYAVLDYFDGRVRAGVLPQKGTALDVADVAIASELKAMSSYQMLQRQRQVQLIQQVWGSAPGEQLRRASDIDRVKAENRDDNVSRAVIYRNGKPHVIEFAGDNGKLIEKALNRPEFYDHFSWVNDWQKYTHNLMQVYTQLSPRFLFYRNLVRGYMTGSLKLGPINIGKQLVGERFTRNKMLARNYAEAAFGAEMLPEVRAMVESEALPPPRLAMGAIRDLPHMRELLEQGALGVFNAERLLADHKGRISTKLTEMFPSAEKPIGVTADQLRTVKNATDRLFTAYEAFEKIYNYQAAIEKGFSPETATAIAQRAGIPRPGVAGKLSPIAEIFFPFTRVKIQGARASYEMMRDPRFRKGFLARFALMEAVPRMAKVAIGIGLASKAISLLTRDDEDAKDPVLAEVMKRVSPYKMALDDVIPFALYDARTGKYHRFKEFKKGSDIPDHYEVVSWRIPSSEEGNLWGTLLYQAMLSVPKVGEQMGRPGTGVIENLGSWVTENLLPSLNPGITTASDLTTMLVKDRNPEDRFRGQPSANPQLFDAGGSERAQAITGYLMNQAGGVGEIAGWMAENVGLLDERARNALSQRMGGDNIPFTEKLPFLPAVISHDNYAKYREEKIPKLEEEKMRAKAKLVMSPDVKMIYDFYWKNKDRQKKLDYVDSRRFDLAKEFMTDVWGKLKDNEGEPNPDSFYSKVTHAVGPDGSKMAKETVKRDLDQASLIFIELFKNAAKEPEDLKQGTHKVDWRGPETNK